MAPDVPPKACGRIPQRHSDLDQSARGACFVRRARAAMNAPVISPAVSAGDTGWSATIDACHGLLAIALGINNMDDTFERACREADRKTAARSQDPRLTRL